MAATAKKPSFMTAKGTASYPYLQPGQAGHAIRQ